MAGHAYMKAAAATLEAAGAINIELVKGKKHPRLYFTHQGQRRFYVLPGSPGDSRRGLDNCLTDLRQMLGVKNSRPKSAVPRRHRATAKTPPAACPAITVAPSPWLALTVHPAVSAAQRQQLIDDAWRRFWRACMLHATGCETAWPG